MAKKKSVNIPLYYQIYDHFKTLIKNEELSEGEALLPERELANMFKVSRATIRQALQKLEEDNLIYRLHGSGTFVSHKTIKQELSAFYSFYEETVKAGKTPSSRVLSYETVSTNKELAEIFKIASSVNIMHIKRLRLIDNEPVMYEDTFIPLNRFRNFKPELLNEKPMYSIFKEQYGVSFDKATEAFSSLIVKDKSILENLGYKGEASCMLIKRITYEKNRIIEYTVSYARGDKYEYKVVLNNIEK
ncbi:GntR family transcriptional regulator [Leptotrichia sp. OH3620_COT-345]|uniref:GntR family transcriptional regulator n=1 Tax=Leptotrichia sp. OH3620_COT-345 TaxID=2491048 RepID=UPI000F65281F|nr:GntR family transcriptional regulator [Leptotrichia sp. OH3620_COT-345]RRD39057.1 GntR family transcriptional regulator [Leptotrichia sp. OH3620_COT-345]